VVATGDALAGGIGVVEQGCRCDAADAARAAHRRVRRQRPGYVRAIGVRRALRLGDAAFPDRHAHRRPSNWRRRAADVGQDAARAGDGEAVGIVLASVTLVVALADFRAVLGRQALRRRGAGAEAEYAGAGRIGLARGAAVTVVTPARRLTRGGGDRAGDTILRARLSALA